jgi:hypothetical protein
MPWATTSAGVQPSSRRRSNSAAAQHQRVTAAGEFPGDCLGDRRGSARPDALARALRLIYRLLATHLEPRCRSHHFGNLGHDRPEYAHKA